MNSDDDRQQFMFDLSDLLNRNEGKLDGETVIELLSYVVGVVIDLYAQDDKSRRLDLKAIADTSRVAGQLTCETARRMAKVQHDAKRKK